ncbi:VWFA domain-containing protein [Meloidogyne graminicola]|uniref:VWFA domain-containing protein n=1 Tax=Meloidogyne graminicola TaxID=189291 RepID=A0A8S9ZT46_9BILA|nr:VWFA domain-containing protein [Meloidogyne graminicola]
MTEEEQMAYALQMSVDQVSESQQPSRSRSPSTMATPAPTPMETEEVGDNGQTGGGVVGDLLNDPARLQQLVDQRGKQSREVKVTQYPSSNKKSKDKMLGLLKKIKRREKRINKYKLCEEFY